MERRIVECEELGIDSNGISKEKDHDKLKYHKRHLELMWEDSYNYPVIKYVNGKKNDVNAFNHAKLKQKRAEINLLIKAVKDRLLHLNKADYEQIIKNKNNADIAFAEVCREFMSEDMIEEAWRVVERRKQPEK